MIVTSITAVSAVQAGGMSSTVVASVDENSSAAAFLQPGDKIVKVNHSKIHIKRDISFALSDVNENSEYSIEYIRDGKCYSDKFTPMQTTYSDGSTGYIIGFTIAPSDVSLGRILYEGFFQTVWMVKLVFVSLGMLFNGQASVSDMSGPVGVVSAMNTAAQTGILDFLFLAGFLAVNIGVMNLLPLPALDGGRTVFALIELIFRKPVPPEKEGIVHFIGFALLIALMLFVTWNDIMRLFNR